MSDTEMTKEEWEEGLMTTAFMIQTVALYGRIEDMEKLAGSIASIPKDIMKGYWDQMENLKSDLAIMYESSGLNDLEELGRATGAIK